MISWENQSNVVRILIGKMLKSSNVLKTQLEIGGTDAWEITAAQNCQKVSALRNVSHLLKKISWNAMVSLIWSSGRLTKFQNNFQRLWQTAKLPKSNIINALWGQADPQTHGNDVQPIVFVINHFVTVSHLKKEWAQKLGSNLILEIQQSPVIQIQRNK